MSTLLVLGLMVGGGGAGAIAAGGGVGGLQADLNQYLPGKGCGDKNHTHTGPLGNPSNTDCPPKSGPKK